MELICQFVKHRSNIECFLLLLCAQIHFCQVEHVFYQFGHVFGRMLNALREIYLMVVQWSGILNQNTVTFDGSNWVPQVMRSGGNEFILHLFELLEMGDIV